MRHPLHSPSICVLCLAISSLHPSSLRSLFLALPFCPQSDPDKCHWVKRLLPWVRPESNIGQRILLLDNLPFLKEFEKSTLTASECLLLKSPCVLCGSVNNLNIGWCNTNYSSVTTCLSPVIILIILFIFIDRALQKWISRLMQSQKQKPPVCLRNPLTSTALHWTTKHLTLGRKHQSPNSTLDRRQPLHHYLHQRNLRLKELNLHNTAIALIVKETRASKIGEHLL